MIKVIYGDIWNYWDKGWDVVCTTNGIVNKHGQAIMGAGIALQTKEKFPRFEYALGARLNENGNHVFHFNKERIFTFPTKEHWMNDSIPELIEKSCEELKGLWSIVEDIFDRDIRIIMTKPGCGNGNLKWNDVKPIIEKYFGNLPESKFLVIDNESRS